MFATAIKKFGAATTVALLTLVACAGSAQALQVVGRWDPRYGAPFDGESNDPNVGMYWAGNATFDFSVGCGLVQGITTTVTASATCTMEVRDTSLFFADGLANATAKNYFATLSFGSGTAGIYEATFVDGKLIGLKSDFFDPWVRTEATQYKVNDFDFTLAFFYDGEGRNGPLLYHASQKEFVGKHVHGHSDPEQFWKGNGYGHLTAACPNTDINTDGFYCGYSDNYATLDVDPIAGLEIPEPQTTALLLLGLGAIGLSTRRRRRGE
jgi:PEP-CTERM motif